MENMIGAPSLTADNQVETTPIATLAEYRSVTSGDDFSLLIRLARQFEGKKLVFLNSTIQGGGVALMCHALIRLFRLLSVDAHWYVLIPSPAAFMVTKHKFHNVLQAIAGKHVILTEKDKRIYRSWILENEQKFAPVFRQANVGKPVVAYRTGGIPLQIQDGEDGFLVDTGDTTHIAHHLYELLTDVAMYQRMSRAAACLYNNKDFLTVSNAICWLFLAWWLVEKGEIGGYYRDVKTLAYHFSTSQEQFQGTPAALKRKRKQMAPRS